VMSISPVFMVMMVSMMRMLVCHGMSMSFVYEHERMFIQVLVVFIAAVAKRKSAAIISPSIKLLFTNC
jgi:hypothetical protein